MSQTKIIEINTTMIKYVLDEKMTKSGDASSTWRKIQFGYILRLQPIEEKDFSIWTSVEHACTHADFVSVCMCQISIKQNL